MKNKNLGFKKEQIVYILLEKEISSRYSHFRNKLLKSPSIAGVSIKNIDTLLVARASRKVEWENKIQGSEIMFEVSWTDADYFFNLGLSFTEGGNFPFAGLANSSEVVILNETSVRLMQLENPVGKRIKVYGKERIIRGIIKDANFHSLRETIAPQLFLPITQARTSGMPAVVLINLNNTGYCLKYIENKWKKTVAGQPFQYDFFDETCNSLYKTETRIGKIFIFLIILILLISSMGLFSLLVYSAKQRAKKIGIRKINGVTIPEIIAMLNIDSTKWIIFSFIISCPIAYHATIRWLQNFACRTGLSWWIFALVVCMALIIALLTVSWQSWKAASRDPVEALRNE